MDTPTTLHWNGPVQLTPEVRALLRSRLDANFSDETRQHGQLSPDCRVQVDVHGDEWALRLERSDVPGWPPTRREWAETQVQSALLGVGIVLPPGRPA